MPRNLMKKFKNFMMIRYKMRIHKSSLENFKNFMMMRYNDKNLLEFIRAVIMVVLVCLKFM